MNSKLLWFCCMCIVVLGIASNANADEADNFIINGEGVLQMNPHQNIINALQNAAQVDAEQRLRNQQKSYNRITGLTMEQETTPANPPHHPEFYLPAFSTIHADADTLDRYPKRDQQYVNIAKYASLALAGMGDLILNLQFTPEQIAKGRQLNSWQSITTMGYDKNSLNGKNVSSEYIQVPFESYLDFRQKTLASEQFNHQFPIQNYTDDQREDIIIALCEEKVRKTVGAINKEIIEYNATVPKMNAELDKIRGKYDYPAYTKEAETLEMERIVNRKIGEFMGFTNEERGRGKILLEENRLKQEEPLPKTYKAVVEDTEKITRAKSAPVRR